MFLGIYEVDVEVWLTDYVCLEVVAIFIDEIEIYSTSLCMQKLIIR